MLDNPPRWCHQQTCFTNLYDQLVPTTRRLQLLVTKKGSYSFMIYFKIISGMFHSLRRAAEAHGLHNTQFFSRTFMMHGKPASAGLDLTTLALGRGSLVLRCTIGGVKLGKSVKSAVDKP